MSIWHPWSIPVEGFAALRNPAEVSHLNPGKPADVVFSSFQSLKWASNMADRVALFFTCSTYFFNASMEFSLSTTEKDVQLLYLPFKWVTLIQHDTCGLDMEFYSPSKHATWLRIATSKTTVARWPMADACWTSNLPQLLCYVSSYLISSQFIVWLHPWLAQHSGVSKAWSRSQR